MQQNVVMNPGRWAGRFPRCGMPISHGVVIDSGRSTDLHGREPFFVR